MIDLHSHILPCVDDGSRNMKETIAILKEAEASGFDTICFTPHYCEPNFLKSRNENYEILKQVESQIKENNINVQLLLGNEIFIDDKMSELLTEGEISSIGDTNYVLIEIPMYQEMPAEVIVKMLNSVREKDYRIIIAHPERYRYIQKNPKNIYEYFGEDVIFQANYASILGYYGGDAKKTIKKLLKNKAIHYLATDIHSIYRCFYNCFDDIKKNLLKVVDKEYFEIMTEINPKLIIENKEVITYGK